MIYIPEEIKSGQVYKGPTGEEYLVCLITESKIFTFTYKDKCCGPKNFSIDDFINSGLKLCTTLKKEQTMSNDFKNAYNKWKAQDHTALYSAWFVMTRKETEEFYNTIKECFDCISEHGPREVTSVLKNNIEVQYHRNLKTFNVYVTDHKEVKVEDRPSLKHGQVWKHRELGSMYKVVAVGFKFVLVNMDSFATYAGDKDFDGHDNDFIFVSDK
jgi:hypothetical protein